MAGAIFLGFSFLLIPSSSEYVRLAIDAGDYDYAQKLLAPVLGRVDPPDWALRDASKVAALQGYPGRATRYLEALLRKSPGQYQDRLELARLYLDLYRPQKAAMELHVLLHANKIPLRDMISLAKTYDIMNLPGSALEILHRIADGNAKNMDYWKAILVYDSQTGNADDMARTLRTLTRHFPTRIDYLQLRMNLAYRRGRYGEALRMVERLKKLSGGLDTSLMPAIRSLFRLKRPVDAYLLYRQSAPNIAGYGVLESAAWYFYKKKYYGYAQSIFENLLTRDSKKRELWDDAVWLSDRMGWYSRTRMLMLARQESLPLPEELLHVRLLDLDLRYHLKGQTQRDLLTWLGGTKGPSLSDLRLAWQNADNDNNLPLETALLRQALCLHPDLGGLRSDLARIYNDRNQPDNAGAVIFSEGLMKNDPGLVRKSLRYFLEADDPEVLKGVYFRLARTDTRDQFFHDQFSLFQLFDESPRKDGVRHLVATLNRFPDLSAPMTLELARILIWRKKYAAAEKVIARVILAYPENRAILFQASDWFVEADQVTVALRYDKKLVDLLPSDPQGLALWIRHQIWSGQDRRVLAYYQRLLRLQPENRRALLYLGDHSYYHGKFRKAIGYYRRAVKAGILDYRVFYRLGQSFRQVGDERMARKMFDLAWKIMKNSRSQPGKKTLGGFKPAGFFLSAESARDGQIPESQKKRKERRLYFIKIQNARGHRKEAYRETLRYLRAYPMDRSGLYWAAKLLWKLKKPSKGLFYVEQWLALHPSDKDFLVFQAEILMKTGRIRQAQSHLWILHRRYPGDPVIWNDLVDSYRRQGILDSSESFDSHIFSQGETQAPRVTAGLLSFYNMDEWSLKNQNFGIFYPGGASYIFDAKIETPLYKNVNYFAGRTEYLGVGQSAGWGTNDFSYAGARWTPAPGWQVTGEAGDTRLGRSPGLYAHLSGHLSNVSIDLQGFDDMIWGDFGQSIVRNGLQSGYMAQVTWPVLSRLSLVAESWLFDYTLENGTLPFGSLHNTMGMADLVLDTSPQIDLVGGYEDWSMMSPSQAVAALVPILARQQFLFSALVFQHQIRNRLSFNVQAGGYEDFYSRTQSYEGGAGVSYRFSTRLEGFASGDYFNQSILYNGASQEVVWGFNLWF